MSGERERMLASAFANLITGTRMLAADPALENHPARPDIETALSYLWRAFGYSNDQQTELGIHDLLNAELLDSWPEDAKPYAVCHSQRIYVSTSLSAPYFSAEMLRRENGGAWWYPEVDLAAAALCAVLGLPFTPEAVSILNEQS